MLRDKKPLGYKSHQDCKQEQIWHSPICLQHREELEQWLLSLGGVWRKQMKTASPAWGRRAVNLEVPILAIHNPKAQWLAHSKKPLMRGSVRLSWLCRIVGFIGGERGIRTLDTLPYTHFPGVRLRPLGHLSTICLSDHYLANWAILQSMWLRRGELDSTTKTMRKTMTERSKLSTAVFQDMLALTLVTSHSLGLAIYLRLIPYRPTLSIAQGQ